jgi:hypothetical protein
VREGHAYGAQRSEVVSGGRGDGTATKYAVSRRRCDTASVRNTSRGIHRLLTPVSRAVPWLPAAGTAALAVECGAPELQRSPSQRDCVRARCSRLSAFG